MRNFLALEGQEQVVSQPVLSLEEEAVVISEVVADSAAIDAELQEVARATDVSEAMEDLAVIADNIEAATPVEGALFDTAANMAVAGTDVEPTALVPASESFKGRNLATESAGIKERARAIWQQIKEALKRIWARIEAFFYKYFGTLPSMKRNIEAARKKVQAAASLSIDKKKFTLTTGLRTLTVNGTVLKSGSDVTAQLKNFKEISEYFFENSDTAKKVGEAIYDGISNFDVTKPNDSANSMCESLDKLATGTASVFGTDSTIAKRYPGFNVKVTKPFFGNTSIAAKHAEHKEGDSLVAKLNATARTGAFSVQSTDKIPNTPNEVEFETLQLSTMEEILDSCFSLVTTLESYQRGKNYKDAVAVKEKLAAASEKATASISRLETSEDAGDRAAVAVYRGLVNMNTMYCNMLANPNVSLATNVQGVVNTMLSLVSKSLAQYK